MTVRDEKRRRLEAKGWKFGTAQEFLRLSDEEAAYIDLKARLATGFARGDGAGVSRRQISRSVSNRVNRASPRWRPATPRCRWIF